MSCQSVLSADVGPCFFHRKVASKQGDQIDDAEQEDKDLDGVVDEKVQGTAKGTLFIQAQQLKNKAVAKAVEPVKHPKPFLGQEEASLRSGPGSWHIQAPLCHWGLQRQYGSS